MSEQLPGSASSLHRCHWYVNAGAGSPSHEPGSAVRTSPALGVVLSIEAPTVFAGATGARATAAVAAETDVSLPLTFVPVTTTRTKTPMSPGSTRTYVLSVAPSMSTHAPGSESSLHRCHWYVNVGAGRPGHEPRLAVRT